LDEHVQLEDAFRGSGVAGVVAACRRLGGGRGPPLVIRDAGHAGRRRLALSWVGCREVALLGDRRPTRTQRRPFRSLPAGATSRRTPALLQPTEPATTPLATFSKGESPRVPPCTAGLSPKLAARPRRGLSSLTLHRGANPASQERPAGPAKSEKPVNSGVSSPGRARLLPSRSETGRNEIPGRLGRSLALPALPEAVQNFEASRTELERLGGYVESGSYIGGAPRPNWS